MNVKNVWTALESLQQLNNAALELRNAVQQLSFGTGIRNTIWMHHNEFTDQSARLNRVLREMET